MLQLAPFSLLVLGLSHRDPFGWPFGLFLSRLLGLFGLDLLLFSLGPSVLWPVVVVFGPSALLALLALLALWLHSFGPWAFGPLALWPLWPLWPFCPQCLHALPLDPSLFLLGLFGVLPFRPFGLGRSTCRFTTLVLTPCLCPPCWPLLFKGLTLGAFAFESLALVGALWLLFVLSLQAFNSLVSGLVSLGVSRFALDLVVASSRTISYRLLLPYQIA